MTVGEVKKGLQTLIEAYKQAHWTLGATKAAGFSDALGGRDESSALTEEERQLLLQLIKNNWQDVITTLQPVEWESNEKILPLRQFQKQLEDLKVIPPGYHHRVCFAEIISRFNTLSGTLQASLLSALIRSTCRAIGYVEQAEIHAYPIAQLTYNLQLKAQATETKLKISVTSMAALFYLSYYKIPPQQAALIPFLIYFRDNTTDEERRSELAMWGFLRSTAARDVAQQLTDFKEFLCYKELDLNEDLKILRNVLPDSRKEFLKKISPGEWHFKVNQQGSSTDDTVTRKVLLSNAITDQFVVSKVPFEGIQEFCQTIAAQESLLSSEIDRGLLKEALMLFKLQQYKLQRENEGAHHGIFSCELKRGATIKAEQKLLGLPVRYGLLEWLAARQGRLGDLQEDTETEKKLSL